MLQNLDNKRRERVKRIDQRVPDRLTYQKKKIFNVFLTCYICRIKKAINPYYNELNDTISNV